MMLIMLWNIENMIGRYVLNDIPCLVACLPSEVKTEETIGEWYELS